MIERLHFHFSLSCIAEGNGNPLQCSCLENPRDGGAWWAAVCGVAQSQTRLKQLSSRNFNSLYFTLRSLIHIGLIFVKGVRSLSSQFFLHVAVQLFQHHCWRFSSLHCIAFSLCWRWVGCIFVDLFQHFLFCSIGLLVYSFAITKLSWLLYLYSKSWSQIMSVLQFLKNIYFYLAGS